MRALKILKKYGGLINQYTMDLVSKDISEAIKELEELNDKTKLAIKALENRSCSNCKRVNSCKLASDVVDNFGTKLREQWFYCWEQK